MKTRANTPAAHRAQRAARMDEELAFGFLEMNRRARKPRATGLTEIRGPYYTAFGRRYLEDVLETMGVYVDSLKFAGGSFALFPKERLQEFIALAHQFRVEVSTGGFIERVLLMGAAAVERYVAECAEVGFDTVELSSGFVSLPLKDWLRLVKLVQRHGMKPKPEIGIQFGAGGATPAEGLEAPSSVALAIERGRRFLDAGAPLLMIESEGITESVKTWRTDVPVELANALGLEHLMFEAADPEVFGWYVKTFGPDVNLFVDHSQIVQLECLREGIWGTVDLWGRVVRYEPLEGRGES